MADEIKIRTLPRGNEIKKPNGLADVHGKGDAGPKPFLPWLPKFIIAFSVVGAFVAVIALLKVPQKPEVKRTVSSPAPSAQSPVEDRVSRYMQEVEAQREMAKQSLEIENQNLTSSHDVNPGSELIDENKDRVLGLQLDQENSAERVYEDLNQNKSNPSEMLPEDRINSRLANAKWINEMERAEQKQFVANFVKAARENGYEVTLNDQLVVVKVRKLPGSRKVSIDNILDQLSRRPSSP